MNKRTGNNFVVHAILIPMSLLFLIPFVYIISISISKNSDLGLYGYSLFPKEIDLSAYRIIFSNPKQVIDAYWVTAFNGFAGTFIGLLMMAMVAYPLSRNTFVLRKKIMFFIFFTMLFGGGLVPTYILMTKYLNLGNTIWIYIVSGLVNAFHIIILRTFFQSLPTQVMESAKIDGASEFRIFFEMILPLSKPALATISLIMLLARWNDWQTSLIYIRDGNLYTLQYLLQRILREAEFVTKMATGMPGLNTDTLYEFPTESMRFAMVMVTSGPMLIIFPFFQKYFTKGLTVGAVKG
jgi:putative aldouronate transport system permease protein